MPCIENTIHVTDKHSGKMTGMKSISCSFQENDYCQNRQNCQGICPECYVESIEKKYDALHECLVHNTNLLTTGIIATIKLSTNFRKEICRFNSFSELYNVENFINYLIICKNKPKTIFTLWTKRSNIINYVFDVMKIERPKNLRLIYSSPLLNKPANLDSKGLRHFQQVFTVYTSQYAIDNNINSIL